MYKFMQIHVKSLSKPNIRIREKCDLCRFDIVMGVGVRQTALSIAETVDFQLSLVFHIMVQKPKKSLINLS